MDKYHEIEIYLRTILDRIEEELQKEEINGAQEKPPKVDKVKNVDPRYRRQEARDWDYQSTEETYASICKLISDGYSYMFSKLYPAPTFDQTGSKEIEMDRQDASFLTSVESRCQQKKKFDVFLFSPVLNSPSSSSCFLSSSSTLPYLTLYLRFSTYLLYYVVPLFHLWLETPSEQKRFIYLVCGLNQSKEEDKKEGNQKETRTAKINGQEKSEEGIEYSSTTATTATTTTTTTTTSVSSSSSVSSCKVILPIAFLVLSLSDTLLTPSPPILSMWGTTDSKILNDKDNYKTGTTLKGECRGNQNVSKNNMDREGSRKRIINASSLDTSTIYSYLRVLSEVRTDPSLWNVMIFQLQEGFSSYTSFVSPFLNKNSIEEKEGIQKDETLSFSHLQTIKEIWSRILTSIIFLPQRVAGHLKSELPLEYRQDKFYAQLLKTLLCDLFNPVDAVDERNKQVLQIYGKTWKDIANSTAFTSKRYLNNKDSFYYVDILGPMVNKLLSLGGAEIFSHLTIWIATETKNREKGYLKNISPLACLFSTLDITLVEEVMKEFFSCLNLMVMYHFVEASMESKLIMEEIAHVPSSIVPISSHLKTSQDYFNYRRKRHYSWNLNKQNPYFKKLYEIWEQFGLLNINSIERNIHDSLSSTSSDFIPSCLDFGSFSLFLFSIITLEDGRDLLWDIVGHRLQNNLVEKENVDTFGHLLANKFLLRKDTQSKLVLRILVGIFYLCDKEIQMKNKDYSDNGNETKDVQSYGSKIPDSDMLPEEKGISTKLTFPSTSLLLCALQNLSGHWNSRTFLHHTDIRRQATISSTIVVLLSYFQKEDLYENPQILNNIVPGVGLHLESTIPELRKQGMCVGEHFAKLMGQELVFDELQYDRILEEEEEKILLAIEKRKESVIEKVQAFFSNPLTFVRNNKKGETKEKVQEKGETSINPKEELQDDMESNTFSMTSYLDQVVNLHDPSYSSKKENQVREGGNAWLLNSRGGLEDFYADEDEDSDDSSNSEGDEDIFSSKYKVDENFSFQNHKGGNKKTSTDKEDINFSSIKEIIHSNSFSSEEEEASDIDDGFEAYDWTDDEDDLAPVQKPRYLMQILELLRCKENDKEYDSICAALKEGYSILKTVMPHYHPLLHEEREKDGEDKLEESDQCVNTALPDYLTLKPADIEDLCIPLMMEFFRLENKFNLENFEDLRIRNIVAIMSIEPSLCVPHLIRLLFDSSYALGMKLEIVEVLQQVAYQVSGVMNDMLLQKRKERKQLEDKLNSSSIEIGSNKGKKQTEFKTPLDRMKGKSSIMAKMARKYRQSNEQKSINEEEQQQNQKGNGNEEQKSKISSNDPLEENKILSSKMDRSQRWGTLNKQAAGNFSSFSFSSSGKGKTRKNPFNTLVADAFFIPLLNELLSFHRNQNHISNVLGTVNISDHNVKLNIPVQPYALKKNNKTSSQSSSSKAYLRESDIVNLVSFTSPNEMNKTSIWNEASTKEGALLLSKIIETLTTFIRCGMYAPNISKLAKELLLLVWPLHESEFAELRRSVLMAILCVISIISVDILLLDERFGSESLNMIFQWIAYVGNNDPDPLCRMICQATMTGEENDNTSNTKTKTYTPSQNSILRSSNLFV